MKESTTAELPLYDTPKDSAASKPKGKAAAETTEAKDGASEPKAKAKSKTARPKAKKRASTKKAKTEAPADTVAATEKESKKPTPENSERVVAKEEKPAPSKEESNSSRGERPERSDRNDSGGDRPRRERGDRGDRDRGRNNNRSGGHSQRDLRGRRDKRGGRGDRPNRNERDVRRNKRRPEKRMDVPTGPPVEASGLLEISSKGFGFLRQQENGYNQTPKDVFVTPELVRSYGLRDGMWIDCIAREGNRGPQLSELKEVCGLKPDDCRNLPFFEELTAVNPTKRIMLETRQDLMTTRVMDLITPVGFGQRGLIVAPPRTGKTTLLQHLAEAVHHNHDYVKIFVLLIDERPEEVTELKRALPFAEVMASSNDQETKSHTRIAQLAIERSKRLVESGQHVFLLMDSITRMARAFNNSMGGGKKRGTSRGGLAVGALEIPRRLFAAARNTREAGSLTIIGTALVQTNSIMDEAIFQEFKGTGNMELVLDRRIAEQYIWPAVNIHASGTRREELLLPRHQLEKTYVIRRGLAGHKPHEAIERLLSLMERFPNNAQMLMELKASV